MKVLIIGAGGHGQVVVDMLLCARDAGSAATPVGYLDDAPAAQGQIRLGLPVLGSLDLVAEVAHDAVIVGIGENRARREIYTRLEQQGERFATAVHPRSVVARDVQIGPGTVVCAGVVVNPGSVIGANVILNTGCTIDHHNRIDDHAHIAPGAHLGGDVVIGAGSLVGIGAIVLPQRRVGSWSVVGAGSSVTRDVPPHSLCAGAPARVLERYGQ